MERIGYIFHPFDGTGYSVAGISYVLAMKSVGLDIVPISVKLASQMVEPDIRIKQLLQETIPKDITTVITHTLPHNLAYIGPNIRNIGVFHSETSNFKASSWQHFLNLMDSCWTSCNQNKLAGEASGIKKPISVVPIAYDPDVLKREYKKIGIDTKGRYVFYSIADFSNRKNIKTVIKGYLEEFSHLDDVLLVLKTYVDGKSAQQSFDIITREIAEIKTNLRKNSFNLYPKIVIITEYLTNNEIMGITSIGNCYISLEKGAGFGIPSFNALAMGQKVIYSEGPGHCDFLAGQPNTYPVSSELTSVYGMSSCPFTSLYCCNEDWYFCSKEVFKKQMRYVYNNRASEGIPDLSKYTYESVGNLIKGILEC